MNRDSLEKLYDEIVMVAYTNLYTLSKNKQEIYLNGFDPLNNAHRALYSIATMLSSNQRFPIHIGCGIFTFWKYKKIYKPHAFAKRKSLKNALNCDEIITHIENAFEKPGIFNEIYNEYYRMEK